MPASQIQICEALAESGTRYRKEALAMPRVLINDTVKHMTVINGLRGKEVEGLGILTELPKSKLAPWRPNTSSMKPSLTLSRC